MFRDDYVLRHISLLVRVIARLLGLVEANDDTTALQFIEANFRDFFGINLDQAADMSGERLMDFVTLGERRADGWVNCAFMARLFAEAGNIHGRKNRPEQASKLHERALDLLLEVHLSGDSSPEMPDFAPEKEDLIERVGLENLSTDLMGTLVFFYEQTGAYDRAEEALLKMVASAPDDREVLDLAVSFYEYLLDEDDETLERGNLSRERVQDGLTRMKKLASLGN